MFCPKGGKETKEATGFCPYCGEKIMDENLINSSRVKEYNDFNHGMQIVLLVGICILIRMMIGIAFLIIWAHWSQISLVIECLIR